MTDGPRPGLTTTADLPAPRVVDDSLAVLNDAIDTLSRRRTVYWLGDTSVHLHALTSLIAQAERLLPDAVHDAREQELTWTEIGHLLNLAPSTAARGFRNNS